MKNNIPGPVDKKLSWTVRYTDRYNMSIHAGSSRKKTYKEGPSLDYVIVSDSEMQ